jgi:GNAT superfamily N-acetyltransferase
MYLRSLEPNEVNLHRELRLRALQTAPDSFGETYTDAVEQPPSYWQELTQSVTEPRHQVMFLACEGDQVVGSTYGLRDKERSEMGRIGGMWVETAWRRRGVGRALMLAVFDWARERGLTHLGLWVPTQNLAAVALYHDAGFRPTGSCRPFPSNPLLEIKEMECEVGAS